MFVFLIVFLPCLVALYDIRIGKKESIMPTFAGFLLGVLLCTMKAFFSSSYRIPRANFFVNYCYTFFGCTVLPAAAVFTLFFFISNDTFSFRVRSFFPLVASFFALYLPYTVLEGSRSAYDFFELFIKPVLYGAFLWLSHFSLAFFLHANMSGDKKTIRNAAIIFSFVLLVPAFIETLRFSGLAIFFWLPIFCLYALAAIFAFVNFLKGLSLETDGFAFFLPNGN